MLFHRPQKQLILRNVNINLLSADETLLMLHLGWKEKRR